MAQRKLTKEQSAKFYEEYVKAKTVGNYAGEVLTEPVWRNQVEELLAEDATGVNWSNTEIRRASHQIARADSWSSRQIRALEKNFGNSEGEMEAFQDAFGRKSISSVARHNQAQFYQFLKGYSNDWNVYFNS